MGCTLVKPNFPRKVQEPPKHEGRRLRRREGETDFTINYCLPVWGLLKKSDTREESYLSLAKGAFLLPTL
jgi:hypothetical protein